MSQAAHPQGGLTATLSANSVNAYVRPIRSLATWLVDEGGLAVNPFRRSRRRASLNPLLPSEDTPTKSATLADLQAIERGCVGDKPGDWRDRAIVSILKITAARNSSVRLLAISDVDLARDLIRFRRAKCGKTLEVALHRETKAAVIAYLEYGRPELLAAALAAGPNGTGNDPGILFLSSVTRRGPQALTMSAISGKLSRRYHRGGGTLARFGSHRIRHATATMLANSGMPMEELSRYLEQSPGALGERAAEALERAGLTTS
jgi:integrase/recombinase XerD